MTCTNCGKELEEGILFCDACGTKVLQEEQQPVYPAEEPIYAEQPAYAPEYAPEMEQPVEAPKPKKKPFALIAAAVAVIAIVVLAISLFGGKKTPTRPTLYVKDKEMLIAGKKESRELTDDLNSTYYSYTPTLAPDGKTMFFVSKVDGNDRTWSYCDITDANSEPVKLDTNISSLRVSENSKEVIYLKEGNLYRHDLEEREKIASDVSNILAYTKDLNKVLYYAKAENVSEYTQVYELHLATGYETEKLATEVYSVKFADEKLKEVYYTTIDTETYDETLYKLPVGGDKEKIDDEINSVIKIYESGAMYYTKTNVTKDAEENETYTEEMFYNDGGEAVSLGEADSMDWSDYALDTPVLIYTTIERVEKDDKITYTYTPYIAIEETITELDVDVTQETAEYIRCYIADDGKVAYCLTDYDKEDKTYVLYEMKISGGKPGEIVEYDADIASSEDSPLFSMYTDGTLVYGKEYKNGKYELYVDGEKVADDITSHSYYKDTKSVIYKDSVSSTTGSYTLNIWNGKESITIADEVDSYYYANNGKVVYLAEVDKNGKGIVFEYSKGKSVEIDDDVTDLVSCNIISYEK